MHRINVDDSLSSREVADQPDLLEECHVFAVDITPSRRHFSVRNEMFPNTRSAERMHLVETTSDFRRRFGGVRHMNIVEPARVMPMTIITPARAADILKEFDYTDYIAPVWVIKAFIEHERFGTSGFVKRNGQLNLVFVHARKNVPTAVSFWFRHDPDLTGWWMTARSIHSVTQYPAGTRVFRGLAIED